MRHGLESTDLSSSCKTLFLKEYLTKADPTEIPLIVNKYSESSWEKEFDSELIQIIKDRILMANIVTITTTKSSNRRSDTQTGFDIPPYFVIQ